MSDDMKGRLALVTGATSGIGEATVERLIGLGCQVIGTGRRFERLEALKSRVGENLRVARLDMTDVEAVRDFVSDLSETPDILVNNAGLALGLSGAAEAELDDWDRMIDTNCRGVVHLTRAMLPKMKPMKRADIINISSVAGSYPYPGGNVYGATKAFVTQFSLNLRADLTGSKVRVTSVEPGLTETEFSEVRFQGDKEKAAKVYEGTEHLTAADIARVICDTLLLPPHININRVEIMPVCQAFGPFAISRGA
ncbi:SDR family NAD(P)-dependent oxidoreductase [Parvularcula sp. ZS-1/3]|uniref:SDR family NAD(P)-dependent oxidoreductase n=1 Tax=Parvularcula mediterranea TaxID=2732508 RepID=A0A7Y3RL83_9PROT|nr:SDR family NAD(P)-dependent oxidoreductase [Parvularcula mediterranea]NNU15581.1 SDR family NAD(P)-dependent oxidoreductase [Parvularcula mediterranea]